MIGKFTSAEVLLGNRSSFLYGRKPASTVPIYAVIKNCAVPESPADAIRPNAAAEERKPRRNGADASRRSRNAAQTDDIGSSMILTNDLPGQARTGDSKLGAKVS